MSYTLRLSPEFLTHISPKYQEYLHHFSKRKEDLLIKLSEMVKGGEYPFLNLVHETEDLVLLKEITQSFSAQFEDVLILGTGGSSTGGKTLCALQKNTRPRVHFLENIDPHSFEGALKNLDPAKTGIFVISKSGSTAETVFQFLALMNKWQGASFSHNTFFITEKGDNPLRFLAEKHNIRCLDHDPNVGGRFSVFSLVGLIPALLKGVDVKALRQGAAEVLDKTLSGEKEDALEGAIVHASLMKTNQIKSTVLIPYCDQLEPFTMWYRQLWAESIGKSPEAIIPIPALGTIDQHSQLQLYLDGPNDKFYTFIGTETYDQGERLSLKELVAHPKLAPFEGRTMGDLFACMQKATIQTLLKKGRPLRTFSLSKLDEKSLGALLMHYILETIFSAELLEINAFDQPAVEESKILAREYLNQLSEKAS